MSSLRTTKSHRTVLKKKVKKTPPLGERVFGSVLHSIASTVVGTKKGLDYFLGPMKFEHDINVELKRDELEILHTIHTLEKNSEGDVNAVPFHQFDPNTMNLENISSNYIKGIINKDIEGRTQSDKDHGKKSELESYIDSIFDKVKKEEIKRLKSLPYDTNLNQKIFFIYNLLKQLKNDKKYNKSNNQLIGTYHRFEGDNDDLEKYIRSGELDIYVGDLKCKASQCVRQEDIIDLTTSGGRKMANKTKKRR
jgi:hypothetical protein